MASRDQSQAEIGPRFVDDFNGDNPLLLSSIKALLELHASGALSHPIPGLARQLLNNAGARLEQAASTISHLQGEVERLKAEHADGLHEIMATLYKAWPHAEDMPTGVLGICGLVEQVTEERNSAQADLERAEARVGELEPFVQLVIDARDEGDEVSVVAAAHRLQRRALLRPADPSQGAALALLQPQAQEGGET